MPEEKITLQDWKDFIAMPCWKAIIGEIENALKSMSVSYLKNLDEAFEHNYQIGHIDGLKTVISIPFVKINELEAKKNK